MRDLMAMPYALAFGALIGLFLSPMWSTITEVSNRQYDSLFPVVTGQARIVGRESETDAVLLKLDGEKMRACKYVGIDAYNVHADGRSSDAHIARIDRPYTGNTKPVGMIDMGVWRVWPIAGAKYISIVTQHNCGGRDVLTELARVEL
jgi:hypothetical protein